MSEEKMQNVSDKFDPKHAIEQLKKHGASQAICPICKGNSFSVQSEVATIISSDKKTSINLNSYVPCAMMVCTSCGHVEFFALGILDREVNTDEPER